jgi:hypothetical protein
MKYTTLCGCAEGFKSGVKALIIGLNSVQVTQIMQTRAIFVKIFM